MIAIIGYTNRSYKIIVIILIVVKMNKFYLLTLKKIRKVHGLGGELMSVNISEYLSENIFPKDVFNFLDKEKVDLTEILRQMDKFTLGNFLRGLLKGITDIIGVYKPDGTIIFYNDAGYSFYGVTPLEVIGKKCYEMVGRKQRCINCTTEKVINTKGMVTVSRYIKEIDKYMDIICNPVFNKQGEIILIIEQFKDITEYVRMRREIVDSEERHRSLIDLSPDAIVILAENKIVLGNTEASKLIGMDVDKLIGENIKNFIHPEYISIMSTRFNQILEKKKSKTLFDYKIYTVDKRVIEVEVASSFLVYKGKPAVQCVIRDITDYKKNLTAAAIKQQKSLTKTFPIPEKASMETLFVPAKTVSGDYFIIKLIEDDLVAGILFDVSGKGVTAAMNISAFKVLYNDTLSHVSDPLMLLKELNKKVPIHLEDNYIAAFPFMFDFKNHIFKAAAAGINRFIYCDNKSNYKEEILKGPFIGMFENSLFDDITINFKPEDRFIFFSDGLDNIFTEEFIKQDLSTIGGIHEIKVHIESYLTEKFINVEPLKDDCTMILMEIK